jgi:hypothetical protein
VRGDHLADFPDRLSPQDLIADRAKKGSGKPDPFLFYAGYPDLTVATMAVVAVAMMIGPVRTTIGNAQHTFHAANGSADTRADRTADDTSDRSGRALTAIGAFARAANDALCMCGERQRQHRQKCESPKQAALLRTIHRQNRRFHHAYPCPSRFDYS